MGDEWALGFGGLTLTIRLLQEKPDTAIYHAAG
jgi:hypothetical protein